MLCNVDLMAPGSDLSTKVDVLSSDFLIEKDPGGETSESRQVDQLVAREVLERCAGSLPVATAELWLGRGAFLGRLLKTLRNVWPGHQPPGAAQTY